MSSSPTQTELILNQAGNAIRGLEGRILDVLDVAKPPDLDYAKHLAKVISKLSPIVANMIEFAIVSLLNERDWGGLGHWERQDPGFPDTIFVGQVAPVPGIEIKTWFPLATEITARFRDSVTQLDPSSTHVALVAWLPEYILWGRPQIIDVWIDTAYSLALARDSHYHNPPDYLVVEPQDTTERTRNLQQTNVAGYKFQGTPTQFPDATREVEGWGEEGHAYSPQPAYQRKVADLMGKYTYRLDTNFAKIDRIEHAGLEEFKTSVLERRVYGHAIQEWSRLIEDEQSLQRLLEQSPSENMIS